LTERSVLPKLEERIARLNLSITGAQQLLAHMFSVSRFVLKDHLSLEGQLGLRRGSTASITGAQQLLAHKFSVLRFLYHLSLDGQQGYEERQHRYHAGSNVQACCSPVLTAQVYVRMCLL
jgi:hypothetical protein